MTAPLIDYLCYHEIYTDDDDHNYRIISALTPAAAAEQYARWLDHGAPFVVIVRRLTGLERLSVKRSVEVHYDVALAPIARKA